MLAILTGMNNFEVLKPYYREDDMNYETEDCQPIPTFLIKSHCLYPLNLIKTSISLLINNEKINF